MKKSIYGVLFTFFGLLVSARGTSTNEGPASLSNVDIKWSVPTNRLPEMLWIYKVVPQNFSEAVISNLMAVASFTMKDRKPGIPDQPPFKDKSILYFENQDGSKHLGIFPNLGWIDYNDSAASAGATNAVKSVPSEDETMRLALKYFTMFGIDSSQLSIKPETGELRVFRSLDRRYSYNETTGKGPEEITLRGLSIPRRIDRIDIGGIGAYGGVNISFGNEGKIFYMSLVWRNLKPYQLHRVISPEEIISLLKSNRIALPPVVGGDLTRVKEITITNLTPIYDGKTGDEFEDVVSPFVRADAVANLGHTNVQFQFICPAVK